MDCLFCQIVDNKVSAQKIYEGDKFLAFLDINPRSKGHTLVIPKAHYSSLLEMPDDHIYGLFNITRMIAQRIKDRLGAKGFNICINNGEEAGQVIPHLHVHIIPRYEKGGPAIESGLPVRDELKQGVEQVRDMLSD